MSTAIPPETPPEEERPFFGVCPIAGGECPGEHNCAPALYGAVRDPVSAELIPQCPITSFTESIRSVVMMVYPIIEASGIMNKIGPQRPLTTAEVRAGLKNDQDP